jgi:hypothetical protein
VGLLVTFPGALERGALPSSSSSLVGSDRVGSEKKLDERTAERRCSSSVFCLFEAVVLPYVDGVGFITGTDAEAA